MLRNIVRNIVNNLTGNNFPVVVEWRQYLILVKAGHLLAIKRDYKRLIPCVEIFESPTYNIITAYQDFTSMDLAQDSCNIKQYVTKRLESNADFNTIATLSHEDISFGLYNFLSAARRLLPQWKEAFPCWKNFWLEIILSVMLILERTCSCTTKPSPNNCNSM